MSTCRCPRSGASRRARWATGSPTAQEDGRPEIMLSSPYVRASRPRSCSARRAAARPDEKICLDERLREKEFGILDGLTVAGHPRSSSPTRPSSASCSASSITARPAANSWVDVIFRLRALLDTVSLHYGGRRVMIVAHQVVVLCLRYVIENLTEAEILAIDRQGDVANCAITEYRFDPAHGPGRQPGARALQRHRADGGRGHPGHRRARRDGRGARMSRGDRRPPLDSATGCAPIRCPQPGNACRQERARPGAGRSAAARTVPGGLRLTAEAAFRAGAGKVQVATVASAALALGVAMPEIAVFGAARDATTARSRRLRRRAGPRCSRAATRSIARPGDGLPRCRRGGGRRACSQRALRGRAGPSTRRR